MRCLQRLRSQSTSLQSQSSWDEKKQQSHPMATCLALLYTPPTESHYSDVIISAIASQITGVSIVCSTVCSGADQRNHQSSASLAFVRGVHRWSGISFTKGKGSNVENVSIWWRHHVPNLGPLVAQKWEKKRSNLRFLKNYFICDLDDRSFRPQKPHFSHCVAQKMPVVS